MNGKSGNGAGRPEELEYAFEQASQKLKRMAGDGMGNLAPRRGAEARYGETYQALVRSGLSPQIRGKYRS